MLKHITPKNPRYEKKYHLTNISKQKTEAIIKQHPIFFKEIYYERPVNNIYLDTHSLQNYFDNIKGLSNRIKFRVRWYEDIFGKIESPTLEIKIKNNQIGTKASYPLTSFIFDTNFSTQTLHKTFFKSKLPKALKLELQALKPTLFNRYTRKYFQSMNKNFRITIDSNLQFYKLHNHKNCFLEKHTDLQSTIVEIKYKKELENTAHQITKHLPFEITRSSKYVSGITALS